MLVLFVLLGMLSSCSNDDIVVDYATNFKVNLSTVIKPFTYEMTSGELESVGSAERVRTRLLIYDTEGNLVEQETQLLSNYSAIMSCSKALKKGDYIAIAISDVVQYSNSKISLQYWSLSDSTSIAKMKISNMGYIGYTGNVLGVTKKSFSIGSSTNSDININVAPAGALVYSYYKNIHAFSDVTYYGISKAKNPKDLLFDSDGNYLINSENSGSYDWWFDKIAVADYPSTSNIYGMNFVLPTTNFKVKFSAYTTDNKSVDLSDDITLSLQAGQEYLMTIDLSKASSNYDVNEILVNSSSAMKTISSVPCISAYAKAKNTLYFKNLK